jgi:hypothetical protein
MAPAGVHGYDPQENVYTYDEFNSMGEADHFKGTVETPDLTNK